MAQVNNEKNNSKSDEMSLKDMILKFKEGWQYVRFKWKTILITGIIGAALGLAYSFLKKPVYTAELSFALDDDKSSGMSLGGAAGGLASQFGLDLGGSGGGAFSGDNLLELMKSRTMVENALLMPLEINGKKQTLAEFYISFNNYRKNKPEFNVIHFSPDADRSKFSLKQDSILNVFYKSITKDNLLVDKVDKKLSIITVKVNSINELFSKYFAEFLVKTVSDFYVETKTKKSVQNVNILQLQTDSVRRELNKAINGVASSGDVNPNANPALQTLRVPSLHHQVDVEANTAILTELVRNLEISKVTLRKETPLIQIIDRPILPLDKDKVGKLKGIVLGGFIAAFIAIIVIWIKRLFRNVLA